jgi:hypothetical protein
VTRPTPLQALAPEILQLALAKGFTKPDKGNLPSKLLWVVTELVEFCDEPHRDLDKVGLELADVALRALGILEALRPGEWSNRTPTAEKKLLRDPWQTRPTLVYPILRLTTQAGEAWRKGDDSDALQCVELILLETAMVAKCLGIDLYACVKNKHEYNKTREYLHGKKRNNG